jgi:hypothetical protein
VYVHLDDSAISIGGTNFTSMAILEDRMDKVVSIPCEKLIKEDVDKYKDRLWIIGNIMGLGAVEESVIDHLFRTVRFVKIEFDYNYCQYRGDYCHIRLGKSQCDCPHGATGHPLLGKIYNYILDRSEWIFYMSERQRCAHVRHLPFLDLSRTSILSSCFTKENFDLFRRYRDQPKNNRYAIMQGFGGWHSEAKGLGEGQKFCRANALPFDIIPVQEYEKHIQTLSGYKGIVFLPTVDDTCPRSIIEAKLLGLEVITNVNSQHTSEGWWSQPLSGIELYLMSRPLFFWSKIDDLYCTAS